MLVCVSIPLPILVLMHVLPLLLLFPRLFRSSMPM